MRLGDTNPYENANTINEDLMIYHIGINWGIRYQLYCSCFCPSLGGTAIAPSWHVHCVMQEIPRAPSAATAKPSSLRQNSSRKMDVVRWGSKREASSVGF